MKAQHLQIRHLDEGLQAPVRELAVPQKGWIHAVRSSLRMSLRQLGERLGVTPQAIRAFEQGESAKTITLASLSNVAAALDMKLVYAFVPNESSFEDLVEQRAYEVAKDIVSRTSVSMRLEDQGVPSAKLEKAIAEKAEELVRRLPRDLWD